MPRARWRSRVGDSDCRPLTPTGSNRLGAAAQETLELERTQALRLFLLDQRKQLMKKQARLPGIARMTFYHLPNLLNGNGHLIYALRRLLRTGPSDHDIRVVPGDMAHWLIP